MSKYARKEDVLTRIVAGAALLVPVHGCTRSVYTLNDTGRRLWDCIATPQSEADLAAMLVEHYRIPIEAARNDVGSFLDDMVRLSLITKGK